MENPMHESRARSIPAPFHSFFVAKPPHSILALDLEKLFASKD
jgi:hypothetical protein